MGKDKNQAPEVEEKEMKSTSAQEENQEQEEVSKEEKLENDLAALNDKHLRLFAEFENYKRRTAKEKVDLIRNASEHICTELLTILDDFERASKAAETNDDPAQVKEGYQLIQQKLMGILSKEGLKPMESSIGEVLDTDKHEAITKIPAPSDDLKGKIVDEVEKGYLLNEKVIRYAKVVVGQ